jgi:hypothetical protein
MGGQSPVNIASVPIYMKTDENARNGSYATLFPIVQTPVIAMKLTG